MFQFPSNGKAYPKDVAIAQYTTAVVIMFQFPSNGKAYPKRRNFTDNSWGYRVSIPFKRESVSKVIKTRIILLENIVSIPFKRESVSKEQAEQNLLDEVLCFNSLQTGKRIQRNCVFKKSGQDPGFNSLQTGKRIQSFVGLRRDKIGRKRFQFPSNGKAYPKKIYGDTRRHKPKVSIPFKRESVSKENRPFLWFLLDGFQFPSNGKAYPKSGTAAFELPIMRTGFNSLQTGKRIQRKPQFHSSEW